MRELRVTNKKCPRCGEEALKAWEELNDEQQEVVRRLAASAEYSTKERATHQWCARCWYEELVDSEHNV